MSKDYLVECVEAARARSSRRCRSRCRCGTPPPTGAWSTPAATGSSVYQETYDRGDLRGDPPQGQEAQLRLAPRRARPGRRGGHAPRSAIGALLGLHAGLAVRGHRPGRPRPGPDPPVVAAARSPSRCPACGRRPAASSRRTPSSDRGLRAAPVRPAARAARCRDHPVDPGAGRLPRRPAPPGRDDHVAPGRTPSPAATPSPATPSPSSRSATTAPRTRSPPPSGPPATTRCGRTGSGVRPGRAVRHDPPALGHRRAGRIDERRSHGELGPGQGCARLVGQCHRHHPTIPRHRHAR